MIRLTKLTNKENSAEVLLLESFSGHKVANSAMECEAALSVLDSVQVGFTVNEVTIDHADPRFDLAGFKRFTPNMFSREDTISLDTYRNRKHLDK